MNGLSLRVSSVKTSDNVRKNAEMRAALVELPKHYEKCEAWYCVNLRSAKTVPEQVACVRNVYQNHGDEEKALQFLCDIFFYSPLKHPVRNQIVKLLICSSKSSNKSVDNAIIVKCLKNSLHQMIADLQLNGDSNAGAGASTWNKVIASVSGCFENFDAGLKSLSHCIDVLFPLLCKSIEKYLNDLPKSSSPSIRNEYYMYIHTSLRVSLNCIQEFGEIIKHIHLQFLQQLNIHCKIIIFDGDIPMDPRTNAGILMAHLAKLNNDFPNFVSYVKDIENPYEIALCVGVINTCEEQELELYSSELTQICRKIDEIANANATVSNILLCATRALYQISKLLLNFSCNSSSLILADIREMLDKLLSFAMAFMEHHMDSVRHISRDIMRNIVSISKKQQMESILCSIYGVCNSEHFSLALKCVILQQAAMVVGADEIINNCKTIFTDLFAENLGKDFIVNNLYEALMLANHKEQPFEKWLTIWVLHLLKIASYKDFRLSDIESLIVKAVKCDFRVVETVILSSADNDLLQIPISTKLTVLWAVRKSGIKIDNFSDLMEKFSMHFQQSILSNDDETRVMALRLLVETNKTTEPLTPLECELLLTYLQFNSNCQSPATRQKSLCMLGKALTRCQIGLIKQMKGNDCKTATAKENCPLELQFLKGFMKILTENLFPGANFSRRSVSLQLLQQCFSIAIECNLNLLSSLPACAVNALLATLHDTYESNKELAVNMLKDLKTNQAKETTIEIHEFSIKLENIRALLISVKPTHSVTASYQLEFICHMGNPQLFGNFEVPGQSPCTYAALKWLMLELKEGLILAELNILEAAKFNPLYGLLFAVNHLLKSLYFSLIAKEELWRNLIAELVTLCKKLTNVVAPIVNSSSPEGHLPNDFSELPKELCKEKISSDDTEALNLCKILSSKLQTVDMASVKTTPQMVLICAWRTVKEVSLILGDIVLKADIQMSTTSKCDYLITKCQILEIGEHFKLLLSETKHRGAFEQAYVGFSKLCCRLWCVEAEDLNSLPLLWLKQLIELISQEDKLESGKICATRRSAGVPFMVQALITSELKVGTTKALMFCMQHLLQLCISKQSSSESRTHALNILRALFRCTDLSEAVGEYVSEGVMAAIHGYNASDWSEKNSSTLLFAALITRIFGVQRTKDSDNLNIRNRMTGRVFFLRYPKLYDFFLDELELASLLIETQQKANKLHPLLLLISRLYPSALEGTESNLKLSVFIPYISKCGSCPEMQTRFLAGKAIVALVNIDEIRGFILEKCTDIMIYCLIKHNKSILSEDFAANVTGTLVTMHQHTQLKNAVIMKIILDIFIEILSSLSPSNFQPTLLKHFIYFTTLAFLNERNVSLNYPVLHKSTFIYNLHVIRHLSPTTVEALTDYLIDMPVNNIPMEQLETCLNIILFILALANRQTPEITLVSPSTDNSEESDLKDLQEEFEIMPQEMQFVYELSTEILKELSNELKSSNVLYNNLKRILEIPNLYPVCAMKSYAILSFSKQFDMNLSELFKASSKNPSDDVKSAITMCVERVLKTQGVNYANAEGCLEYLMEIAQPSQPYCLRFKAAASMSYLASHYPESLQSQHMTFTRLYIQLMLMLLMDDDYDIRDFASKLVLSCVKENLILPLYDEQQTITISPQTQGVVSTVAQRVFIQYTVELLKSNLAAIKEKDDFIIDVFKMITNQDTTLAGDKDPNSCGINPLMDVHIFDKNEANDFAEPLTIITDAVIVFKLQFEKHSKVLQYIDDFIRKEEIQG